MKNRRTKGLAVVLCAAVMFALVSCSSGGSASDVARDFFKAGNAGNYGKAKDLLSIHLQVGFESTGAFGMDFESMMDGATRDGTIETIEVRGGEELPGGIEAIVYLNIHYRNGDTRQDSVVLMKEIGKWRIIQSALLLTGQYN